MVVSSQMKNSHLKQKKGHCDTSKRAQLFIIVPVLFLSYWQKSMIKEGQHPHALKSLLTWRGCGASTFHTNSSWQMSFPIANAWDDEPSANSQGTSEQCRPLKFFISNIRLHQYHPRKQISSRRCLFDPSILFRCTIICLANLFLQNQHNGSQRQWPSHSPARGRTCICFHGLSYQLVCM